MKTIKNITKKLIKGYIRGLKECSMAQYGHWY
jgi:hypothetical protein